MRDYKPVPAKNRPRARWLPWFFAGLGLPLILVSLLLPDGDQPPPLAPVDKPAVLQPTAAAPPTGAKSAQTKPVAPRVSEDIPALVAAPEPDSDRTVMIVRRGDSMDRMFRRNNLSITDLHMIMQEELASEHLRVIKPGDEIVVLHREDKVIELHREIDYANALVVARNKEDDGYTARKVAHKLQARQVEASGRINSSLFLAAADAGISERAIMNLAGIFAWDIDFVLDIRQGDEFRIIAEELWRDGKRIAEGDILAAEFVNQGKSFRAIRFEDPEGNISYYSPKGANMRKAFLRAPLSFSRISSNFNPNRRHPVLNTIRAHKGVDYAASHGTPIKAAGDGKVIFRGVKGGYGNVVILQHGGNITTLYAHMSNFNRQARLGTRVKQGQVIGYVGQSGLASGPHLHYEYRKNGVHMNPRTVSLPDSAPINPAFKDDFKRVASPLITKLDKTSTKKSTTAGNSDGNSDNRLKVAGKTDGR